MPDVDYHFKITVFANDQQVSSFDRIFSTEDYNDHQAPIISDVHTVYITGTTATIQWETDEPATAIIYYGKTEDYGKKKYRRSKKEIHDLTLTRLKPGTVYHFKIRSKDKDGNQATYHDMDFRTAPTSEAKRESVRFSRIKPISQNDPEISYTAVEMSWHTNKLASGWIKYGTKSNRLSKKAYDNELFRDFDHSLRLTNLKPNTRYYFRMYSKDVFGKTRKSAIYSIVTKALPDNIEQASASKPTK